MQINITQYVMVKIPRNMGIFDEDKTHKVGAGLQKKLLAGLNASLQNKDQEEGKTIPTGSDDNFQNQGSSKGGLLAVMKLRDQLADSQRDKIDDKFRV